MSSLPVNFDRIPTRLASQITRRNLNAANTALLHSQVQLATSKRVAKPSDDPIASAIINLLDDRLAHADQRERNLQHASSVMGSLDTALEHIIEAAEEAKTVASAQIGVGSDASTRASQAVVVSALIDGVYAALNRDFAGIHYFGGSATGRQPIESFNGGYRYTGEGLGLSTDIGAELGFPITIGADQAIGALSARVEGDVDLNAQLVGTTRIRDLRGPGGEIEALGTLEISINDGTPPVTVLQLDLSQAQTMGDVARAIESAIRDADPAALGGVFPSSVGFSGERLGITGIAGGYTITFGDGPSGRTASDLGIDNFNYTTAATVSTNPNRDLNPRLSDQATLGSLNPTPALSYGDIIFRSGGRSGTVTTSSSMTIGQLKEAVSRLNLGIRIEIDDSGDTINAINEVSGAKLSIEEDGTNSAAESLGIRSLGQTTPLSSLNHGRGVRIAHGQTGSGRNEDFEVTLTNGSTFVVDLEPADIESMASLLAAINADAVAGGAGAVFSASLNVDSNTIVFADSSGGAGTTSVRALNAQAAEDLGLLDGSFVAGSPARLVSEDRSQVRVDSLLTSLIELREALERNDTSGIEFAASRLEDDSLKALQARALVGARASRISDAQERLTDTTLLDQTIKSDLQDLDYIEAASRFSLLQTQLQAGLQSAAAINSLSLLNFLG